MRLIMMFALAAVAGCHNRSLLDGTSTAEVDALWDLAPDGLAGGVVGSGRATGMIVRAIGAARTLAELPDFAPLRPQLEQATTSLFGAPNAAAADAGLAIDRGFALFVSHDGAIMVMPVADRDKYVTSQHGKRGDLDTLDGRVCKPLRDFYVCASDEPMFAHVSKGSPHGKAIGPRGDLEILSPEIALMGGTPGDLWLAAHLDTGRIAIDARFTGQPAGVIGMLSGLTAPQVDASHAASFGAIDFAPLLANMPALPLAGGVTLDAIAKTISGPVTFVIPAGSNDLQLHVPLSDPGPATTIIEHCKELPIFELAPTQAPGACRFLLRATGVLEHDAWVEGKELRIGAHKGPATAGLPGVLTPDGAALAAGKWTGVLWGRGSMLDVGWLPPAPEALEPRAALGIHALALINELGMGLTVDKTGVALRMFVRTAWDNPPDVVAKVIAFDGSSIAQGKSAAAAKALAASAPGSPFAADVTAGQDGLLVPAATLGLIVAIVLPAVERSMRGGDEDPGNDPNADPSAGTGEPPDPTQIVAAIVHAYADDAYPKWAAAHPDKTCPSSLAELAGYLDVGGESPPLVDPWNHPFAIACGKELPAGAKGIAVSSFGPDGKPGTPDDIRSW